MDAQDSKSQDLSALISNAESAAEKQAVAPQRRAKAGRSPIVSALLIATLVVILAYCSHWMWLAMRPPSQARVAHDLELAVDQARASIEETKASTGSLPDALPNASLAAVVQYEPDSNEYKLVATMMGVRVTLQKNGSKSTDVGVAQ